MDGFWVSGLEDGVSEGLYLIWSFEHGGWWGPGGMGYTWEFSAAGRYSGAEAREIVLKANRYRKEQMEVMVSEADGVKFTLGVLEQAFQEIEGLKREVAFMASNDYVHSLTSEVERLKGLLSRAADGLEEFDLAKAHLGECPVCRLIAEVRKAAG
jgi:hypothetical protein